MTVRELITALLQYDMDCPVYVRKDGYTAVVSSVEERDFDPHPNHCYPPEIS